MPNRPLTGTLAMPTITPRWSLISNCVPICGFSSFANSASCDHDEAVLGVDVLDVALEQLGPAEEAGIVEPEDA